MTVNTFTTIPMALVHFERKFRHYLLTYSATFINPSAALYRRGPKIQATKTRYSIHEFSILFLEAKKSSLSLFLSAMKEIGSSMAGMCIGNV